MEYGMMERETEIESGVFYTRSNSAAFVDKMLPATHHRITAADELWLWLQHCIGGTSVGYWTVNGQRVCCKSSASSQRGYIGLRCCRLLCLRCTIPHE